MRLIDADALEREGWKLHRSYQQDKNTMVYETKSIQEISTAQPEPQWIPCSERLPEEAGWYLCTYKDGRVNTKYWSKDKGWVDNIRLHMFELYDIRSRLTKKEVKLAEESIYWDDWVKAWMPLPEPYLMKRKEERKY